MQEIQVWRYKKEIQRNGKHDEIWNNMICDLENFWDRHNYMCKNVIALFVGEVATATRKQYYERPWYKDGGDYNPSTTRR